MSNEKPSLPNVPPPPSPRYVRGEKPSPKAGK